MSIIYHNAKLEYYIYLNDTGIEAKIIIPIVYTSPEDLKELTEHIMEQLRKGAEIKLSNQECHFS